MNIGIVFILVFFVVIATKQHIDRIDENIRNHSADNSEIKKEEALMKLRASFDVNAPRVYDYYPMPEYGHPDIPSVTLTEAKAYAEREGINTDRPFFCTDRSQWTFVNLNRNITKTIIYGGEIQNFPGIEHPELVMIHYREGRRLPEHFGSGSYCASDGSGCVVRWCIQPDGRYYADEDGFGAESQEEIELYADLDDNGDFMSKFRIRRIGGIDYEHSDLEEQQAEEYKKRMELEKEASAAGAAEGQFKLINKALEEIIDSPLKREKGVKFPAIGKNFDVLIYESGAASNKPDDSRFLDVKCMRPGGSRSCLVGICFSQSIDEFLEKLKDETTPGEVYRVMNVCIDRLNDYD